MRKEGIVRSKEMDMKTRYTHTDVDHVVLGISAGADLFECKKDAASLALEHNVSVCFIHNDRTYEVNPYWVTNAVKEIESGTD